VMAENPVKARTRGRWSLRFVGVNAVLVAVVAGWWVVAGWAVAGGGDPPGPQFTFAALVLPALFLGGGLFLAIAAVGAVLAISGWAADRRLPGHPYATLNAVALCLHLAPPVLVVLGRMVWLSWEG
jgi:hypothetical protein